MNRAARHFASPPIDPRQREIWAGSVLRWLPAAAIVLAGLAAYSNSLHGPFIFDDLPGIVENPLVSSSRPVPLGDFLKWQTPVVVLTLRANYLLAGPGHDVWGFHATNLAIHLLAALTLFGIVRRTFRSKRLVERFGPVARPLALMVALVWMLHPVQTQAVTYIIQRKESLMGLFYLLALYCFIRGANPVASGQWLVASEELHSPLATSHWPLTTFFWFLLAVLSCAAAMGTKQVAVTAPFVILLYDAVFLSRPGHAVRRRWPIHLALMATLVVLAFTSLGRLTSEGLGTAKISRWAYARSQPGVILHYLRLIVLPVGLCLDPGWPVAQGVWQILPQGVALVLLLAGSLWLLYARPGWGFWAVWFFLILAPTSSLIVITELAFDHRVYLSSAGLAMLAVMGGYVGAQRFFSAFGWAGDAGRRGHAAACVAMPGEKNMPARKKPAWAWHPAERGKVALAVVTIFFSIISAGLGLWTHARNEDYRTALSIWQDTVEQAPDNARAQNNFAAKLFETLGDKQGAMQHLDLALHADPKYPEAWNLRGNVLAAMGETEEAIEAFTQAIHYRPDYAHAYCDRGKAKLDANRYDDALADLNESITLEPDRNPFAYNNRGNLWQIRGKFAEAVKDYDTAIAQDPDEVHAYVNRGWAYANLNQLDRAAADYSTAIRLDPSDGKAYNLRSRAYAQLKEYDLAWDDVQSATRLGQPPEQEFVTKLSAARQGRSVE